MIPRSFRFLFPLAVNVLIRHVFMVIITFSFIAYSYADEVGNMLKDTDITEVGMDMFTTAYNWESKVKDGFNKQALKNFTKKLNAELLRNKDKEPYRKMFETCECDAIVRNEFDAYILAHPTLRKTTGEMSYDAAVVHYLHPSLGGQALDYSVLGKLIQKMLDDIGTQTQEQMSAYQDVSGVGLYIDGDTDNSPYDLMDDIRRIDEIFLREAPEYGDYRNTSKDDAGALITGRVMQGQWAGGENYNVDLASDISAALGESDGGSGSGSNKGGATVAGECKTGYCMTMEFVKNTSYFLGPDQGGPGASSFQGIYEQGLDWLAKKGDKINLACKAPPTMNVWELENDFNFDFKKYFSGVSVSLSSKLPPFLKGFFDRNTEKKTEKQKEEAVKKEKEKIARQDQETIDTFKRLYKENGLDYDKPNNLKNTIKSQYELAGMKFSAPQGSDAQILNAAQGLERGREEYQKMLLSQGSGNGNKAAIKEQTTESIKHMETTYEEFGSRMRFVVQNIKDFNVILKKIASSPECGN